MAGKGASLPPNGPATSVLHLTQYHEVGDGCGSAVAKRSAVRRLGRAPPRDQSPRQAVCPNGDARRGGEFVVPDFDQHSREIGSIRMYRDRPVLVIDSVGGVFGDDEAVLASEIGGHRPAEG